MKTSIVLCVLALLSASAIAAPQEDPDVEHSILRRGSWGNKKSGGHSWSNGNHGNDDDNDDKDGEGDDNENYHGGASHRYLHISGNRGNDRDSNGEDESTPFPTTSSISMSTSYSRVIPSISTSPVSLGTTRRGSEYRKESSTVPRSMMSTAFPMLNASSCSSQGTSIVTITINNTITITQSKTRSHPSRYSSGLPSSSPIILPVYWNTTSAKITLSTGYSTGVSSFSPIVSPIYTNSSSFSTLLGSDYPTSLHGSSTTVSPYYVNHTSSVSSSIITARNRTSTRTHNHRSRHSSTMTATSLIFIPASTSLPPSAFITSSLILMPTTTLVPTTTLSGLSAPTGTPVPAALLCNVHGFPIGDYFLGQLVESGAGMDVTLYNCYRFCAGIFGVNMGCHSFDFYAEPGTGAPRCDLYSASVAQSIDMIIPQVPNTWYDIGCVVPMQ